MTPEDAAVMLARVAGDEPLATPTQRRLYRDMGEGSRGLNGAPIVSSINHRVPVGRARLSTCVAAEAPFDASAARGVAADAFDTIAPAHGRTTAMFGCA